MPTNRLIHEKSPYLLQHAHNPVDWYSWGTEAFEKARTENKPIFLSVGYSTCHWCHVMEHESFESEETAGLLNRYFVPVKVDREERPDIDRIYMLFVQTSTGSGGWPMSVFLTPDLKPFFGGTYFPPDSRYGRPGFPQVLQALARAWESERERIEESGTAVLEQLGGYTSLDPNPGPLIDRQALDSAYLQFRRSFDTRHGGFGNAPKFPRPVALNFLLRYSYFADNADASAMVLSTLKAMAAGGMNDQLGGGFHRYSVDERWFVPHFEKMLYDQAQLAQAYVEAFQVSGDESLAQVARDIFDYVLRDLTHSEGGFFSAEDADSVIDPAEPGRKGEGAFYIWKYLELEEALGGGAEEFARDFGAKPEGNVEEDPHEEFTGKNILYRTSPDVQLNDRTRARLLESRSRRVRPHLDDKVLTAWNGLMISALVKGGFVLNEPRYIDAAIRAAEFIWTRLYSGGHLARRFRDGDAAISGFLDDYAFFGQALLDLYESTLQNRWFHRAVDVITQMKERFEDPERGAFFSTEAGDPSLLMRIKDDYDGAEPSGNSVAVLNLVRLAHALGREDFRVAAEKTFRAFASRMQQMPTGIPQILVALMRFLSPPKQIVLSGEAIEPMLDVLRRKFLPNTLILEPGITGRDWPATGGAATAYVCENFSCRLPTSEPEKLDELLQ